ncbi:MAG: M16 family metallopeptidase, partial [Candidatus Limnocylindrales bacterium]
MFQRTCLADGPRVISARLPGSRAFTAAAYVLAGSRLEGRSEAGVAHFMEHLTFRGTAAFPTARDVSEAIEGVGGTTNAATDRESTVYWAQLPLREARRGLQVLGELVLRPHLSESDIEHERAVIVEEIRSYRDDASQYVYDVFDEAFFGDTPLGWEVAGTEASVQALAPGAIRAFWQAVYRPANLVVAVVADLDHEAVVAMVEAAFGQGAGSVGPFDPAPAVLPAGRRLQVLEQPSAQAHLCLGLPALRRDDPDQWTLELLDTILGDGSSSRLFLNVREEAGLAYDVHSFHVEFADCGALEIYAGVAPDRVARAAEAILAELRRLADEPLPPAELAKARAYSRGRLELRLEESRHLVSWIGAQEALHDRVLTPEEA